MTRRTLVSCDWCERPCGPDNVWRLQHWDGFQANEDKDFCHLDCLKRWLKRRIDTAKIDELVNG